MDIACLPSTIGAFQCFGIEQAQCHNVGTCKLIIKCFSVVTYQKFVSSHANRSSVQLPHPSSTDHKGNSTTSTLRNASILTALLSHCHSINRWGNKNPTMLQLLENAHKLQTPNLFIESRVSETGHLTPQIVAMIKENAKEAPPTLKP
jgi:hypothetical protein